MNSQFETSNLTLSTFPASTFHSFHSCQHFLRLVFTMKILALHGKQQNAEVFRGRCSKLTTRAIRENLATSFYFQDAPFDLPLKEGDQVPMKTWFLRNRDGRIDKNSLDQTLSELEELWCTQGPFNGILGFSMGGAMASIMASLPSRFPHITFVLIAGAPDIESQFSINPHIQSLHMVGLDDKTVLPKNSHALANRYCNARVAEHELGHCLPMKANHTQIYLQFLHEMHQVWVAKNVLPPPAAAVNSGVATVTSSSTDLPPKPILKEKIVTPMYYCASDEIAALQSEEVEVLSVIYPEEFRLLPQGNPTSIKIDKCGEATVPAKKGDLCASFHILLLLDPDTFEPESSAKFPRQWIGQIGLHFTLLASYPLSQAPIVTVTTGKLTLSDGFSDSKIASLEEAVRLVCTGGVEGEDGCVGEACGMLCMQAAQDWFSSGQWLTAGTAKSVSTLQHNAESSEDEEDPHLAGKTGLEEQTYHEEVDEVVEAENIHLATMEAYEKAHLARVDAARSPNTHEKRDIKAERLAREAALLPASARGVWTYTVGLVGKPSAGKSTFYNAVTRAALERGGRLMAEVAPHPFTTIEPNVGPGWYASFEEESEYSIEADNAKANGATDLSSYRRYPLHGRVPPSPAGTLSGDPSANTISVKVAIDSYMGRRMLPVVVKDVAGLVPGAYKGRGKGNRFLADLCDADVLVHVVDVTGQADRDGNAVIVTTDATLTPSESASGGDVVVQDKGSSPMEDAEWIREELHRWIYGNVRGKWNSVLACTRTTKPGQKLAAGKTAPLASQQQRDRAAQRVLALFTGYQGPRWCVELAAERAGLQLEYAATWTARDLHRMVAHFLSIRFPVCLALNKIDALDASDEAQAVIAHCQETARRRGEAAVPVSARAECWILNQQAAMASTTTSSALSSSVAEGNENSKKKPTAASLAMEETLCKNVLQRYGTTGVLEAISEAVKLRPPVLCYPVCDLESECPVGWTPGKSFVPLSMQSHHSQGSAVSAVAVAEAPGSALPRLQDCLQLKPGSTVGDVFEALKRGVLSQSAAVVHGEFVRADARCLSTSASGAARVVQLRKDSVLDASNCVLRVQTNRKSVWQGSGNHVSPSLVPVK